MTGSFNINYRSGDPIYQQIYNEIVKEISLGILSPDEKLPTVRELASSLGINPNTVAKAYQLLEQNGYTYSQVGKGSFVADNSGAITGLREMTMKELKKHIRAAYDYGVEYEAVVSAADEVYYGGEKK